jgi:hypothetical protein
MMILIAPVWQDGAPGGKKDRIAPCKMSASLSSSNPAPAATVTQTPDFPMWSSIPTVIPNQVDGVMPLVTSSSSGATVNPPFYQATWMLTIKNVMSCISGQQVRVQSS